MNLALLFILVTCSSLSSVTASPKQCAGDECVDNEGGDQAIFISGGRFWEKSHAGREYSWSTIGRGNSTEVLDIDNDTCSRTTADLCASSALACSLIPHTRRAHSSHQLNNSLVICGGYDGRWNDCIGTATATATTGGWAPHSTTGKQRENHSGTVVDNKIYLVGLSQTTEYWDGERWQEGPRLPHKVGGGSCTVTTSPTTILVTGGAYNGKKVVELNITTGRWRYLPDMEGKRKSHACTLIGRKVVVAGGWNARHSERKVNTTEILDLDTEQWSRAGDLTPGRDNHQMVTVNERVIILGGKDADENILDTVEELDMEQRTWRRLPVRMKTPRMEHSAIAMKREDLCAIRAKNSVGMKREDLSESSAMGEKNSVGVKREDLSGSSAMGAKNSVGILLAIFLAANWGFGA